MNRQWQFYAITPLVFPALFILFICFVVEFYLRCVTTVINWYLDNVVDYIFRSIGGKR